MRRVIVYSRCCCIFVLFVTLPAIAGFVSDPSLSFSSGREWFKLLRRAQRGDHKAQLRLGVAYQKGEFVKQDLSQAFKWFLMAAQQADPLAEHNVALMLYVGRGTEKRPLEALKWFEKAAAAGIVQAKFD